MNTNHEVEIIAQELYDSEVTMGSKVDSKKRSTARTRSVGKSISAMRGVCASNAFKETLTALEICELCEMGFSGYAQIIAAPLADGGDGTLEVLSRSFDSYDIEYHEVTGSLPSSRISAPLLWQAPSETAGIELARVCGLAQLPLDQRDPKTTTTRGVGELILKALEKGARKIVIGIGGSSTNDAGTGALRALGWQFLDAAGKPCQEGGIGLATVARIVPGLEVKGVDISVLCDVQNPLIGPQGASQIYGPQKGASPQDVIELDRALSQLVAVAEGQLGVDLNLPGYGAAGGFSAGAVLGLGASVKPGFTSIAEITQLESKIRDCDFVITGEGCLDEQTLCGKAVAGVLSFASKHTKPVILIVGSSKLDRAPASSLVISLVNEKTPLSEALTNPRSVFLGAIKNNLTKIDSFISRYSTL